eukprot:484330-Pelagomonas_calceolata.AAC.1
MRQQLGITGLPQTVISVRLMMMFRTSTAVGNMSSFIAHIPRWSHSAGNMLPCSLVGLVGRLAVALLD